MTEHETAQAPLHFHRLASLFPLIKGREFDELVADIKAHGLREQITLYQGEILEGRNRYRACFKAKHAPEDELFKGTGCNFNQFDGDDDAARAFVISKNIHRRHLTAKQRRELLVKLVAAQPEKSDRAIAAEAKVDHHQVARARKKAEATGTKVPVEKRTGADGKKRKQPAKKKKAPAPAPTEAQNAGASPAEKTVSALLDDFGNKHEQQMEAKRRLEIENEGLKSEIDELKAANAVTLQAAIEKLIEEAKHLAQFINGLSEDVVYAAEDIDVVINRLHILNDDMASRRKTMKQ